MAGNSLIDKLNTEDQYRLFHAMNAAARILLASMEEETFEASVLEGMSIIAHCFDFDRGYIWQNEVRNGALHYAMRFEWQNDTGRRTNPVENYAVYPYTDVPTWELKFLHGECVNGPLNDLTQAEKERLLVHGMKSVYATPVYMEDSFWGYISFDDCRNERILSAEEISVLRSVSLMIVNAINRNEQLVKYREEYKQRDNLLDIVNKAAAILLQVEVDEFESALLDCMGMMGDAVSVDRVYIWRNHLINDKLYATQLFEWSEGAEPQQDSEYTIGIPYAENMPGWEETLSNGECINSLIREMDPHAQAQLAPQGIISILVVPVFLRDQFWGFVGFDDCHNERIFTENEKTILRSGSLLIAHALLRNDLTLGMRTAAVELADALKNAQTASRAKSDFLSNMSHEMRTPMNAIIGMTQIGKSAANMERKDYAFEKIQGASNHLLGVINDVLDMSKIEAGKFELAITGFDFEKMLQKVINVTGFRIDEKKQQFHLYVDPAIPSFLSGDDQRLIQVITNLLTNAVKFTPEYGSIWLSAYLINDTDGTCNIRIEVKDTGIGISRENQKRLFSPFEQEETNTSRKFGGTGLGLAICKRIVELMNGKISVESDHGKGALFIFTFQANRVDSIGDDTIEVLPGADERKQEELKSVFKGHRLLLAEDVEINREIVILLLEPLELIIDCAVNGAEAVSMFKTSPYSYDMIFMDMQMPQIDGLEATRQIRAHEAELGEQYYKSRNGIPIIAMTANVFKEDVERCLDAGMNAHIGKPLDLNEVIEILKCYLSNI